jgi:anti-sigma B factor antagonist
MLSSWKRPDPAKVVPGSMHPSVAHMTRSHRAGGGQAEHMQSNFVVETRNCGRAVVLSLSGELDLVSTPQLEEALRVLDDPDTELLVLDLSGLEFMDSTGLHLLVRAQQAAEEAGRRLAVVRGREQVQRLLNLTGMSELLTIVDSPDELLEAGRTAG